LPELHQSEFIPKKPELKKVNQDTDSFEKLLYVWEFLNNFGEYLNLRSIKIEELFCGLFFTE